MHGFAPIGLAVVDTDLWGGMMVTVVVAAVGIVVSLPIGVVLALGRRSQLPAVRLLSTLFIEFVRGVPLITVLFMASVMLPLFVPDTWSPDKLMRALVGVALFSSAYMAEVVRAGLQSIPKGQYEAAHALGLAYWQSLRLIILPQALKVTIPNIVNSYIALFKDTTLVFFVGIFDFLKTIEVARADPKWATPVTSATGYVFAALVYFVCCYAMSRYASRIESEARGRRKAMSMSERRDRQPPCGRDRRPAQMVRRIPCARRHQSQGRAAASASSSAARPGPANRPCYVASTGLRISSAARSSSTACC